MNIRKGIVASYTAFFLIACGGGGGGGGGSGSGGGSSGSSGGASSGGSSSNCYGGFSGSATTTASTAGCTVCSTRDLAKAIDEDLGTAAEVTFSPVGGTVTVRATAQPGTVFPAGNHAGGVLTFPASVGATNTLRFTTYLSGVQQETGGGFINVADGSTNPGVPNTYRFPTTKPFDSVEAAITRQGSADTAAVGINEFCNQ